MTRFITWSVRPENGLFMKSKVTARNLVDYTVYNYIPTHFGITENNKVKLKACQLYFLKKNQIGR